MLLTVALVMAVMAAVSAIPAGALEYGTGSSNDGTHGYVVVDGLYAEGGSYDASGSELWSGVRTDEMQASGWSYNDSGTQTTGGSFYNDEMQAGAYTISSGRSAGRFMTDEMDVYGYTDNGDMYGHVDLGEVCYGDCGQG